MSPLCVLVHNTIQNCTEVTHVFGFYTHQIRDLNVNLINGGWVPRTTRNSQEQADKQTN